MSSIRNKLVVFVALLLILAVAGASGTNYYMLRQDLLADTGESLKRDTAVYAVDIGRWLEIRTAEISMLANSPLVIENNPEKAIPYLADEIKRLPGYLRFFVVNLEGNAYYSNASTSNLKDRDYFQKVVSTGKPMIADPVISKVDNKAVIVVAAPILRNGKVDGVMGATITIDDLSALAAKIKEGKTGYGFIIQQNGLVITHPDSKVAMTQNFLKDTAVPTALKEMAERMSRKENGIIRYDFGGVSKFAGFAPIPGTDWASHPMFPWTRWLICWTA